MAVITLTFEGLQNGEQVLDFYNGGSGNLGSAGPNYGIQFGSNTLALIDSDAGGTGNFANEPSPSTVMFFLAGSAVLNYAPGFTNGFSFQYTTLLFTGSVRVYSGLNATGTLLGTIPINALGAGGPGDPTGQFAYWAVGSLAFAGTARSVDFGGTAAQVGYDNITFGSTDPATPPPLVNYLPGGCQAWPAGLPVR